MQKNAVSSNNFDLVSLWMDWGKEFHTYSQWLERNRFGLLIFLFSIIVTLFVFTLLVLVLKKILLPEMEKKYRGTAEIWKYLIVPFSFLILLAGISLSSHLAKFPVMLELYINKILFAIFIILLLNGVLHIIHTLSGFFEEKFRTKDPDSYTVNKLLLDLSRSLMKLAIWVFGSIFILQDIFGLHITALMASAGILGLGIAFAAQNTIGNLFGAFSILGSKLFKVGDWIKTGSIEGVVEQIGFRSVRIRAFDGRLLDVPNRLVADSLLENYSNREYWREHFTFSLTYQTTPEEMKKALSILEETGRKMQKYFPPGKMPRFTFLNYSASSLDIDGYVWFKKMSWYDMRSLRGDFNTEVLRRFMENDLDFAYPTTTVYLQEENKKKQP